MAAKKPTRVMSNARCIVDELSIRCDKSHRHQHLVGGRASKASEYPDGLCRANCRGLARQKKYDVRGKSCSSVDNKGQLMNLVGKTKEIDKIEDDPDDRTFPAHSIDTKHEVDGTDTMQFEISVSAFETDGDDPRAYDEDKMNYYVHTGPNTGAEILSGEMREIARRPTGLSALIERPGGSLAQMTCQGRALPKCLRGKPEHWR